MITTTHDRPPDQADNAARLRAVDHAVLGWVAQGLGLATSEPSQIHELEDADWSAVVGLFYAHRLTTIAAEGLALAGPTPPAMVTDAVERFRAVASRMNAANLLTMRQILPRFEAAGIPVVTFKGPVLQQMIYGDLFARPSSDVDLLVAPEDFGRSRPVLEAAGYDLAPECRSIWWRAGLGEQHYEGRVAAAATVDLHHRVQQPGCPLPSDMDSLMAQAVSVNVGGQSVRTLSPVHSHLLTAMNFVKAVHHREPSARYVVDFVAYGLKQPASHWADLEAEALRQGLGNTVALTLRACRLLLPVQNRAPEPSKPILSWIPDAVLWDMILHPDLDDLVWPRRRSLLYALHDHKRDYPLGFAFMIGSEFLRQTASHGVRT